MTFFANANRSVLTAKKRPTGFSFSGDFINREVLPEIKHEVMILRDFADPAFCRAFLDFFKLRTDWKKSVTYGEVESGQDPKESPRQSDQIMLAVDKTADQCAFQIFNAALQVLNANFGYTGVTSDEGYSLLRYNPGGEYKPHTDQGSANGRSVSGLIYLNDDYEGGELHFPRQDFTIKPKPGMVVMFPSSYTHLHAAMPVKSGTKFTIVTWFK